MAITVLTSPSDFGRVYDTNRLMYKLSSTNYTEQNFRFLIILYSGDITNDPVTYTKIATIKKRPLTDGTCFFNPAEIFSNYLTYDIDIDHTVLNEALNSNMKFSVVVFEIFGDPQVAYYETLAGQPVLFNGLQEYIPYDIEAYGGGNNQWVMSGATDEQGKFLTDALDYRVDTYDYASLYFLASKEDRPTHARYTIYYWDTFQQSFPNDGTGWDIQRYTDNSTSINYSTNISISAPTPISTPPDDDIGTDPGEPTPPVFKSYIADYITGFTISYTNTNNQMYYIPSGPAQMESMGLFDNLSGATWISYQVDLTDGLTDESTVYNTYTMTYYRQNKCSKYDPWQLFWLNPHGGFDRYTFYLKNYISYDLERTMWQHRFSDTYTLGERGSTVYKTKVDETIMLNTDWLTESESQIISQLFMSPEVYASYKYKGLVYKIPYVIKDTKAMYKEIKNEKMVSYEVNVMPAWNRVSQTS